MKEKFIPKDTEELFLKMKEENLKGQLSKEDVFITWELDNHIILKILMQTIPHERYIETYYHDHHKEISLTHWHPMEDEIYDDLMDIQSGKTIWVKRKGLWKESKPMIMDREEYEKMSEKRKKKYTIIE